MGYRQSSAALRNKWIHRCSAGANGYWRVFGGRRCEWRRRHIEWRNRHIEWIGFLRYINREMPRNTRLHLICDNSAIHKLLNVVASTFGSISISPRPRRPGAIWSNASLATSPTHACATSCFAALLAWSAHSTNTLQCTKMVQNRSSERTRPMTPSPVPFAPIAAQFPNRSKYYPGWLLS